MTAGHSNDIPIYELAEWKSIVVERVNLSLQDRQLATELSVGEVGRLIVEELRSGVRVSATSWVGVARFEQFEVRIIPKLAGGNIGLVEMIEFAAGLDALRRSSSLRTLETEGASLFDLIALLLAESCERIARGNLLADYVEVEEELPTVRGRLLGDRQLLKRFGLVDRVICRYDELEQDVVENQILAAALEKCSRRVINESVRLRVGRMRSLFIEACSPENLNPNVARQLLDYTRQNAHYRDPHALAWLILDGLKAVKDIFTPGGTRCFAFLLDMNLLFERFVHRLFERSLDSSLYIVDYQRADRSIIWDADKNKPYSRVIPDLLIRSRLSPLRRFAIDAKYKLYDDRKISPGDVYQCFLYAYAFGQDSGIKQSSPAALIVYPSAVSPPKAVRLHVKRVNNITGAEILALGISISDCLKEIESLKSGPSLARLREIVERTVSA